MKKKNLLSINLNEFNLKFLIYGAKKYNCDNIKKFLKLKKIKTFSVDKIQNKNLDPWVQNISINSGQRSSRHKIFNLGEKIPKNIYQIWDYLSKNNFKCGVWGPMNSNFKKNKNVKIFMPDPWNYKSNLKPVELKKFYKLARIYAREYTDFKILKNLIHFYNFFFFLIKTLSLYEILKFFPKYLYILLKGGIKNYHLFFIFDIISLLIFKNISKKHKLDFSLVFLNSLAHFQHNNWDEKQNYKYYFYFADHIFSLIFEIAKNYEAIIIYNSFSQKRVNPSYLIRPKNPISFFKEKKIFFSKFHSNMTNGFIISFKNYDDFLDGIDKINKLVICGFKIFKVQILNKNQLFCRIQIQSKKDFSKIKTNLKSVRKNFFYDKKNKIFNGKNEMNINEFVKSVSFIKTTGKHIPEGELFYKNINIKYKNKIENTKIFELIKKNFFNENKK